MDLYKGVHMKNTKKTAKPNKEALEKAVKLVDELRATGRMTFTCPNVAKEIQLAQAGGVIDWVNLQEIQVVGEQKLYVITSRIEQEKPATVYYVDFAAKKLLKTA